MRLGLGLGIVLAICSVDAAIATDAVKTETAGEMKVATAEKVGSDAIGAVPAEPVTRTAEPPAAKPKSAAPTLVAKIDLSEQRMTVTANGRVVGQWPISSGRTGYETPPGRFRPTWTSKMHFSRKYYNSPMPYSVFFNGGIATHGTQHNGMLGQPASHGCIRLKTANARDFYNLVHRHGYGRTRIVVTGRARQSLTASRSTRRSTTWGERRTLRRAPPRTARRGNVWGQSFQASGQRLGPRYSGYQPSRGSRMVFPGDRW